MCMLSCRNTVLLKCNIALACSCARVSISLTSIHPAILASKLSAKPHDYYSTSKSLLTHEWDITLSYKLTSGCCSVSTFTSDSKSLTC